MEKYGDLSKSEKYRQYGENAYKLLKPLYLAKESSWSTKDVTCFHTEVQSFNVPAIPRPMANQITVNTKRIGPNINILPLS